MAERRHRSKLVRALGAAASVLDPRAWAHIFRLVHFYNYTHVKPRRALRTKGRVFLAPNVSLANGERIEIGEETQIGARCTLWAGDSTGRIVIGAYATFGPECFLSASDYGTAAGTRVVEQEKRERDIVIGADVWLGARVTVTAGVTIGDGCVVGAGSVVTKDLPPNAIAVGVPARVVGSRT
ncbi:MAG: acyltransferase [Pseudomonadota bacterium]